MSIIEVKNITKIFGSHPKKMLAKANEGVNKAEMLEKYSHALGLHNINLNIEKGEVFVIMGLSGSGKSTLIRHFNRLIEPTGGQILINGEDVTAMNRKELRDFRRQTMSMVFQHFGLMPHKTVIENASYAQTIMGVPKKEAFEKGKYWLEMVGLKGYENNYPKQLSGGQQQRVGLARALAADTDIILMDEAFSALDPLIRSQMQDQLLDLQERFNKTIVFITHDLAEALHIGSRIAILNEGKVAQIGTPSEILNNPADDYVTDFVKDVNRAKALTVESVVTQPAVVLQNETSAEALEMLNAANVNSAVLSVDGIYKGIVSREALLQSGGTKDLLSIANLSVSVEKTQTIEQALPVMIENKHDLVVVDENNAFIGIISNKAVIEAIS